MCFSATASFGAGIVLAVLGTVTIRQVQHPAQRMFASIPFIFAIQQITEGLLWITLPYTEYYSAQNAFTHLYLVFAHIVWPVWIPVSILLLEKVIVRKKIQKIFVAIGLVVSLYLAVCLLMFPVRATIVGYHIAYKVNYPPALRMYGIVLYAVATLVPSFFSTVKRMWLFGTSLSVAYLISAIFYEHYILSVWCFFAAILSLSVYAIIVDTTKKQAI